MNLSSCLGKGGSDLNEVCIHGYIVAEEENEDILSIMGDIFATYHEIYSKDIGPWSEVSETMEQERTANRFIDGLDKQMIKKMFIEEFQKSEEPWRFYDYIARKHNKYAWGKHQKFFNSIARSKKVGALLLDRISEVIPFLLKEEDPMKKLTEIIWLNTKIRENAQIKEIILTQMEKGEKLESYVISSGLVLVEEEANIIQDLEKIAGKIPHLQDKFKVEIRRVSYGVSASSRIEHGFYVENRHIIGLGLTDLKLKEIPSSIGGLTKLRLLCLNTNRLKSLPESLGDLTNLEGLYLDTNKLTELPSSIGKLINLQEIYVRENKLKTLLDSIGALQNVTENKLLIR